MINNEIQKFEDEIRELYFKDSDEILKSFWIVHLKPVIDQAKGLTEKYNADLEVVWLSAILHDIGQFEDIENHDVVGSEKAYEMLIKKGFKEEIALKVKDAILTHRVKNYLPETLEQKILATADAMTHFTAPHYVWMARTNKKTFSELMEKYRGKIERDYKDKIFFEDEKRAIEPQYELLKKWFEIK